MTQERFQELVFEKFDSLEKKLENKIDTNFKETKSEISALKESVDLMRGRQQEKSERTTKRLALIAIGIAALSSLFTGLRLFL